MALAHNLGFPRLGDNQETLKIAKHYQQGHLSESALQQYAIEFQKKNWKLQSEAGLDIIPVGDFSWYDDHVLETTLLVGNIPARFRNDNASLIDTLFCMATGQAPRGFKAEPCKTARWFDTHYHYVVPEFSSESRFCLESDDHNIFAYTKEALAAEYCVKPVILGPLSFLWLGHADSAFDKLSLLEALIPVYREIFSQFQKMGIEWIQVDEPILGLDLPEGWRKKFQSTYKKLRVPGLKCLLASYFSGLGDHLSLAAKLEVDGLHLDCCRAPDQLGQALTLLSKHKILSAGIVDGRNVWCNDLVQSLSVLETVHNSLRDRLWIAPSCSLLHVPLDSTLETQMNPAVKACLAFAKQKIEEVGLLNAGLNGGKENIQLALEENKKNIHGRRHSTDIHRSIVQQRLMDIEAIPLHRTQEYIVRKEIQNKHAHLPLLPVTLIGSPSSKANWGTVENGGDIERIDDEKETRQQVTDIIAAQVDLDLDLFTPGTLAYADSLEYFAKHTEGMAIPECGWIQKDGSHTIKLPIIYGDLFHKESITAQWIQYAQSLTTKPIKGLLAGPLTLLFHSFIRDDQSYEKTALQVALALRDEIQDLERAGIYFIEIEETTVQAGIPLQKADWATYFNIFVKSFKLATSGVNDHTQTHLRLSDLDITPLIETMVDLDADIIILGNIWTNSKLLEALNQIYPNDIGLNIYDSPHLGKPSVSDFETHIKNILKTFPIERLWIAADRHDQEALQDLILAISRVRILHMASEETSVTIEKSDAS
jgi:5-methyltetrahydropteroyltriglutamate--homocysteine methyltransferase